MIDGASGILQSKRLREMRELPEANVPAVRKPRLRYDCSKCPAYCCSYERIDVSRFDLLRLARFFGITPEKAEEKYTKIREGDRVFRHRKDHIYGTACQFLDPETRRCTIYAARPAVCRDYPEENRCGYYEFLSWEREHQDDPDFIPLSRG
jgi:Fe-S-cluster containining protein